MSQLRHDGVAADRPGTTAVDGAGGVTVSFEVFPPRSDKAAAALDEALGAIVPFGPTFVSVTYGAGGSTSDPDARDRSGIRDRFAVPTASHLTYVATPIWDVASYAARLREAGIDRVVALRGDAPAGRPTDRYGGPGFFRSTPAFIASLLKVWQFDISIAAHPEKHPDATWPEGDIEMLAMKADAGARRALTQFFLDNDIFFRFRDEAVAAGVEIPIVPGVLPILEFGRMTAPPAAGRACRTGSTRGSRPHGRGSPQGRRGGAGRPARGADRRRRAPCPHVHAERGLDDRTRLPDARSSVLKADAA
ncbi:MAG: methylenetetrahydrofolate reductase [Hyphomicrobiaceae bacterium]